MVSRADKKLFLNAMVAETDPSGEVEEEDNNNDNGQETTHALGIQGANISKRELSSLIRFGANAIIDHSSSNIQITEDELNTLLECGGRDESLEPQTALNNKTISVSTVSKNGSINNNNEIIEIPQSEKVNKLEEVDLRQLGNVLYTKKKASLNTQLSSIGEPSYDADGKRKRTERITMVDGKGTGYGGSVPILTNNLEDKSENLPVIVSSNRKGRTWNHQTFCCLCGVTEKKEETTKCAHCPRIFHDNCLKQYKGVYKGSGMFICPHHKCAGCNRSTASSGGLLFRCLNCFTSYCEDCLPEDEIESIGRSRDLELIGYDSKQSYYIKCGACTSSGSTKFLSCKYCHNNFNQ